jgi:choline dehydrogenase-like flavoprotein
MSPRRDRWVVVGAGVAGCVVASRLAEWGLDVVLVEEGPAMADRPPVDVDAALAGGRGRSGVVVRRSATATAQPYTAALGVGGGSGVNAMIASPGGPFTRPHRLVLHTCDADDLGPVDHLLAAAVPSTRPVDLTAVREGGRLRRVTVAEAYLPVAGGGGPLIVADTRVERVLFDDDRATGVVTADGTVIEADRVVVCGGAIATPLLLWRTGVDHPAIGTGFSDHPSVTVDLAPTDMGWGPGPSGVTVAASSAVIDDVQVLPVNATGSLVFGLLRSSVRGVVVPPAGGGVPSTGDPVFIEHHVADHDGDVARLAEVIDRVLAASPARPAQPWASTVDMVREHLAARPPAYTHGTSTCAIGTVTDAVGAVRDRRGLFVVDASLFPVVPPVNPMLPTVQLAETILGRWRATGVVPTP